MKRLSSVLAMFLIILSTFGLSFAEEATTPPAAPETKFYDASQLTDLNKKEIEIFARIGLAGLFQTPALTGTPKEMVIKKTMEEAKKMNVFIVIFRNVQAEAGQILNQKGEDLKYDIYTFIFIMTELSDPLKGEEEKKQI